MKKLDNKIKGLNIELDKNTKLYELNGVIDKFKKTTDNTISACSIGDVIQSFLFCLNT